ncbi:MAG TPA: non-homologous end-joining DNA ligase [Tepidisphaeraceae bacterium]|nr:non-homologous end-joining DNA ligase [Tepidisphaeraceae bacterium]
MKKTVGKKAPKRSASNARSIKFSNLEKVLYPAAGFTKGQVIDYYRQIAPIILPYLRDRPLTLKRYPNGVDEEFFYEKRCPSFKPAWMATAHIPSERQGFIDYCVIDSIEGLLWIANLASLELHTLLFRAQKPDRPTMMVFDLDPGPPADLLDCLNVAIRIREMFSHMGLEIFPKTSGGKGLHIYVPLNTAVTFDQTKTFARHIALLLEKDSPQKVLSKMSRAQRSGKVFVDWSQNDSHKTTVCPYSLRARKEPTVSTPVSWKEIESAMKKKNADSLVFRTDEVVKRIDKIGDLFEPVLKMKQRLPALKT